jgi:Xaa-Pro aminopeptidase
MYVEGKAKMRLMGRFIISLLLVSGAFAQSPIDSAEYQSRRRAAMDRIPDGIIVLHSITGLKRWDESGLHQDASFYAFTGLTNAREAILVLDGTEGKSWLFTMVAPRSFGLDLSGPDTALVKPGPESETALKIDHVVPWDTLVSFIDSRRKDNPKLVLYLDSAGQTGGMAGDVSNPPQLAGIENPHLLWRDAMHRQWSDLQIKDAFPILDEVRWVKSPAELVLLRKAASITEEGFWAGALAIAPGKTQRQVEGEVIRACLNAGSDGPSLWPWVRSGPYTMPMTLFEAFADYHNLDRTMQAGEVVRLDLGCDFRMYKGDFGRMIPVSGRFDAGQKETIELLNGGYLSALDVIKPGATVDQVIHAFVAYVEAHQNALQTPLAREAAAGAIKNPGQPLHGLGVDMAEGTPKVFHERNVICFEPMLIAGNQGYFVEDTILITHDGHEVLNPQLPYAPDEIERAIAKRRPR